MTGQALPAGEVPHRALFPGPALSPSQRSAAEAFWGSGLCAVQGPPGTGKTRLILQLCAEALLRQTEALLEGGSRAHVEQLLITSSNNRAVDNVIEPLDGPRAWRSRYGPGADSRAQSSCWSSCVERFRG